MPENTSPRPNDVNWRFVALYYLVAYALSAPFNAGWLAPQFRALTRGSFLGDMTYLPACLGTLAAFLLVLRLDTSHIRTIVLFGNSRMKNIVIALAPVAAFAAVGLDNGYGLNRHWFALSYATINLAYAVLEEIGWRGYLQDALRPLKGWGLALIGLLWWAWHIRYSTVFDFMVFPLICVGGSLLIGQFTEKTKSYLTAGGLHCLIILLTNSGAITHAKMLAGGLTVLVWIAIGQWWQTAAKQQE
jgi:uncharacterized protein